MGELQEVETILKGMKKVEIAAENALEFIEKGTEDPNKCPTPGGEDKVETLIKDVRIAEAATEFGIDVIEIVNANRNANNSHILELPHLPHEAITGSSVAAHLGGAVNSINKVAGPLSVAASVATTGYAAYEDYEHGTSRNTVETLATIGGGLLAGHGGALGGAALGTAFFPGVGTIVGGVVGAIGVGLGGALTTNYFAKMIGDSCGYDLVEKQCKKCGKPFRVRQYLGQADLEFCNECSEEGSKEKAVRGDAKLQQNTDEGAPSKEETNVGARAQEENKEENAGSQEEKHDAPIQEGNEKDAPLQEDRHKKDTELLDKENKHIPLSEESNTTEQ